MNCWEILGIEPTDNLQKVKQAYAKKLKTIDIKNDVEQFQKLKESFNLAKKITQQRQDAQKNVIDDEISTFHVNDFIGSTEESHTRAKKQISPEKTTFEIANFESSLTSFLEEEVFYDEVANWQTFLQSYLLIDIESFREIQICLRSFLIDYYQIISLEVRTYIFELSQMEDTYGEYNYILDYADFDFSFYQEISLPERRDYFYTRKQLFFLFFQPDSMESLSKLLRYCKDIYQHDSDLALLEAYQILWQDFRLSNPQNIIHIKNLIQTYGKDNSPWDFVQTYCSIVISKKITKSDPVNLENIFQIKDSKIPDTIYDLLAGNCAFLTKQHRAMYNYWHNLQEEYPEKFTDQELMTTEQPKKRVFLVGWRFVIAGILILRFLFKIGQMNASSPSDNISGEGPISFSDVLSNLEESESDDLWNTEESSTDFSQKDSTFTKDLTMFSPNPNDDEPVSYKSYKEGGFIANVPDYEHYNQVDAETILGSPSRIVVDIEEIQHLLEEQEVETISSEVNQGNLTVEQGKAFGMQAFDSRAVVNRVMIYNDGKPNVYLSGNRVIYITPITKYINFNGRLN